PWRATGTRPALLVRWLSSSLAFLPPVVEPVGGEPDVRRNKVHRHECGRLAVEHGKRRHTQEDEAEERRPVHATTSISRSVSTGSASGSRIRNRCATYP